MLIIMGFSVGMTWGQSLALFIVVFKQQQAETGITYSAAQGSCSSSGTNSRGFSLCLWSVFKAILLSDVV